jgi:hypothetical protein
VRPWGRPWGRPWAQERDLILNLRRHPELRGCHGLRTLGDALQARDELEAVLHAPNRPEHAATRTAWNGRKVSSATNADSPNCVHCPATARLLWGDCRPARGRSHGLEAGSKHVAATHARLKLGRGCHPRPSRTAIAAVTGSGQWFRR